MPVLILRIAHRQPIEVRYVSSDYSNPYIVTITTDPIGFAAESFPQPRSNEPDLFNMSGEMFELSIYLKPHQSHNCPMDSFNESIHLLISIDLV